MLEVKNIEVSNLYNVITKIKNSYSVNEPELSTPTDREMMVACKLASNMDSHSSHDSWLKGIIVHFDVKLNLVVQPEFQRYHFIEIIMQQSRVHSLKKLFSNNEFNPFTKYVTEESKAQIRKLYKNWLDDPNYINYELLMHNIPCGLELWASCVTNYLQLKTILIQRYNHPHKEDWGEFCKFIHNLPEFDKLTNLGDLK